ncbi:hypothetical protein ACFSM5_20185 [Lacibacterium aquatile]|uniref:Uncharacterized protein n=1 Tax=Lacibacterium aquatile TaxID=1168082 RepID=A0ABW5DWV9_9PROT
MSAKTWLISAGVFFTISGVAMAATFKESCIAGGGGMFEEAQCACLEKNTDATEKKDLQRYFELQVQLLAGKAPATQATSDELQKGGKVLEKHLAACMG